MHLNTDVPISSKLIGGLNLFSKQAISLQMQTALDNMRYLFAHKFVFKSHNPKINPTFVGTVLFSLRGPQVNIHRARGLSLSIPSSIFLFPSLSFSLHLSFSVFSPLWCSLLAWHFNTTGLLSQSPRSISKQSWRKQIHLFSSQVPLISGNYFIFSHFQS